MKTVSIKVSNMNLKLEMRVICEKCGAIFFEGKCANQRCRGIHSPTVEIFVDMEWRAEEMVCCGKPMLPTGLKDCNGWKCENCGHEFADIASMKLG